MKKPVTPSQPTLPDQPAEPERLDLRSHDIAADKRAELLRLFPEVHTEGGKIDFEHLRLALGEAVDVGKERYGLTWPGKAGCFKAIQAPSLGTLLPCPEESVAFDTTENLFIEGDNLEVLKLLQKAYQGQVKMIYIDPPYNTGNDFIYPDDYAESLRTYLEYTGQVDSEGRRFSTNTDTDGRFHSKWLNMMYPRLYLARNLLREEGLIFVSIDEGEHSRLRLLLNEVFGEENHVSTIIWKKGYGGGAKVRHIVELHEYILCFSRNKEVIGNLDIPPKKETLKYYKNRDEKYSTRGPYRTQPLWTNSMDERPNLRYSIPWNGRDIWPEKQWQWEKPRVMEALANDELEFIEGKEGVSVYYKQYLYDEEGQERPAKMYTVFDGPYTQSGTKEIEDLLGDGKIYSFPKPSELLRQLIELTWNDKDAVVMDFFAGSCSTAHGVLSMNNADGGSRKFIMVQLPESTPENSPARSAGFSNISDVGKERIRRVIKKLNEADDGKLPLEGGEQPDRGFRVYKLAESNFAVWNADVPRDDTAALERQMELHVEHVREGRGDQDILYEILLKSGFPLTAPVERVELAGSAVFSVADGAMLVCLERKLTLEAIRVMAAQQPERVVCLDAGFAGNDPLKVNAVQLFKAKGIVFRTI